MLGSADVKRHAKLKRRFAKLYAAEHAKKKKIAQILKYQYKQPELYKRNTLESE